MILRVIFLALVCSIFFIMPYHEQSFSVQTISCIPHTVCVHPGDKLTYSVSLNAVNNTQIYKFSNMIDSTHIRIIEQNLVNERSMFNNTLTLSMKTGFVQNEQDTNIVKPFITVLASPISYNKSDVSIFQKVTNFNGFKRTTLNVFHSNENDISTIEYDLKTGILLSVYTTTIVKNNNKSEILIFSNKLIGTNMINSNSDGNLTMTNVTSMPQWIQSTLQWWAHNKISDSEFVKIIQNMVSNEIISSHHISSHEASLQSIPGWIKHDVNWWSAGLISDDEFVKIMQWLVNRGIVKV